MRCRCGHSGVWHIGRGKGIPGCYAEGCACQGFVAARPTCGATADGGRLRCRLEAGHAQWMHTDGRTTWDPEVTDAAMAQRLARAAAGARARG